MVKKITVLITGGDGYVGSNLKKIFEDNGFDVFVGGLKKYKKDKYKQLDITDKKNVQSVLKEIKPDVLIHAAALSSLKKCNEDPELANEINFEGTKNIVDSIIENKLKTKLIFFSSDYVFEGDKGNYREEDKLKPTTVYGKTKVLAEKYIRNNTKNHIILRTANIFGKGGNFFNFILTSLNNNEKIDVYSNVYFTPTYIDFLAYGILKLIEADYVGIIHIAGKDNKVKSTKR